MSRGNPVLESAIARSQCRERQLGVWIDSATLGSHESSCSSRDCPRAAISSLLTDTSRRGKQITKLLAGSAQTRRDQRVDLVSRLAQRCLQPVPLSCEIDEQKPVAAAVDFERTELTHGY